MSFLLKNNLMACSHRRITYILASYPGHLSPSLEGPRYEANSRLALHGSSDFEKSVMVVVTMGMYNGNHTYYTDTELCPLAASYTDKELCHILCQHYWSTMQRLLVIVWLIICHNCATTRFELTMKTQKAYLLLPIPNLRDYHPIACSGKPNASKRQSHLGA